MGIPFYFFRICQKYKSNQILSSNKNNYDILYFDYNSLIHPCAYSVITEWNNDESESQIDDKIIDYVIKYTEEIISYINPKKKVVIAIDGVAPRAKMNQQRERRYKKSFGDDVNTIFDTNMITPGTPFMSKLNHRLHSYSWNFKNVIISDSTEIGEGEHKIMKMIQYDDQKNHSHIIYGLDGDLIMLSLISDKDIVLFRDDQQKNTKLFLNIQRLKKAIFTHLMSELTFSIEPQQILMDYILLCFLLGNDFIPSFANLSILSNGIEILEKAYYQILNKGLTLTKKSEIVFSLNLEGFSKLIEILYDLTKKNNHLDSQNTIDSDSIDNENIKINTRNFIKTKELYNIYYALDKNSVNEWINGLNWILQYYQGHFHKNWTWFYPYENTPHIEDVIQETNDIYLKEIKQTNPFTPIQQLFMVLPQKTFQQNKELTFLYELSNSYVFKKYFPTILVLDGINKKFIWQCKPIGLLNFEEELIKIIKN